MKNFDQIISDKIFFTTKSSPILSAVAKFCATYLLWGMIGVSVVLEFIWHFLAQVNFSLGTILLAEIWIFIHLLLPWIVTMIISLSVRRKRPFRAEHHKPLIHMPIETPSFPSAHATLAFAVSTIFIFNPILFPIALVLALCVSLGRVAVGVHYLSDIAAGFMIGFGFWLLAPSVLQLFM